MDTYACIRETDRDLTFGQQWRFTLWSFGLWLCSLVVDGYQSFAETYHLQFQGRQTAYTLWCRHQNTTDQTPPDQTRHTVKTETAVKLIHNHPVQAVTETRLTLHLCQPGCVIRTRDGHMAMAATKNQMLLNSTHKWENASIQCFLTFAPGLVSRWE